MKLLTEKELIWSDVVANNRMNRKRQANGINSYEQELGWDPIHYLLTCIEKRGTAKWLDLCCGEGLALIQTAKALANQEMQQLVALKGIDLVDYFQAIPPSVTCLQFETASLVNWEPTDRYDLITCIHGLHYIGDKLQVIATMLNALTDDGLFFANLDLDNIKITGDPAPRSLRKLLNTGTLRYDHRKKQLRCEGPQALTGGYQYAGADDQAGPNYTGQPVVNSYYTRSTDTRKST